MTIHGCITKSETASCGARLQECVLPIAFASFVLMESSVISDMGLRGLFEYSGLFLLLLGSVITLVAKLFKGAHVGIAHADLLFLVLVGGLLVIGLVPQDLSPQRILTLIISNVLLLILAVVPNAFLRQNSTLKCIAFAILISCVATTVLALLFGYPVVGARKGEGIFEAAFAAGQTTKNFFAYEMLAAFVAFDMYIKAGKDEPILSAQIGRIISVVFMLTANCLSIYPVLIAYLVSKSLFNRNNRFRIPIGIGVLIVIAIAFAIGFVGEVVANSSTYAIRTKGLENYLDMYSDDMYHMIFGNAEMAYRDSEYDYVKNVRSVTGWDGTLEIAWLDILIKNGILGVIAYILIFIRLMNGIREVAGSVIMPCLMALGVALLLSTLVESYACNLHTLFGPYCYLLLCSVPYSVLQREGSSLASESGTRWRAKLVCCQGKELSGNK